jgi:putative DNA primase/helicase
MPELDSLTRTEETRLKAFITLTADTWIPKYSNLKMVCPRRTIFVGTTNDESYLKGQTGNTRFLPIKTGPIDLDAFLHMRTQIFAEALQIYHAAPDTWWALSPDAVAQAEVERETRRVASVYEDSLADWLGQKHTTTWQDIAQYYLHLEKPADWKDKGLQMQIGTAMRALGWQRGVQKRDGKAVRLWIRE